MVDISYGSIGRDILFHILRYSTQEIRRFSNISLFNVEGSHHLIWQNPPYLAAKDSRKSPSPMLCQWGYRAIVQVLAMSSAKVPAGRGINFEGLAFAFNRILRQNTLDPAICRFCLSFPLNNSNILVKGLIIPLITLSSVDVISTMPFIDITSSNH